MEPKRQALKKANEELAEAEKELGERQNELATVQAELAQLQKELQETMDKKAKLEEDVKMCAMRLKNAKELIEGLGGERARWGELVEELKVQFGNITGDILISSGVVAYLGVFVQEFRDEAVRAWSGLLREKGITCAENYTLVDTLGEPVVIRDWVIKKLPNDNLSVSNAIMLKHPMKWR